MEFYAKYFQNFNSELKKINSLSELDQLKAKYLGKNSILTKYFKKIINFKLDLKIKYSIILNKLKNNISQKINDKRKVLKNIFFKKNINSYNLDPSLPGRNINIGSLHPITLIIEEIKNFFKKINFMTYYGPEIEDVYHNFDALNISENHPSRNISDTFWFDSHRLLRTQTSSVQIRALKKSLYPLKMIFPGKVYRNDYDNTHTPMFHQVEGLVIDRHISFANLKWILQEFIFSILNKKFEIRFRSSYFPFTSPSAEIDIKLKNGKWLEILGCGMVHPNVLRIFKVDLDNFSAFAFGLGVERIAMLRYSIPDIRSFFINDLRFLKQFS